MNKHWLVGLILFTVNASCMEEVKLEKSEKYKSIFSFLPSEMVHHTVHLVQKSGQEELERAYVSEDNFCCLVTRYPLCKGSSHQVRLCKMSLDSSTLDTWMPSINLNPCIIVREKRSYDVAYNVFSVQCWHENGRHGTKFRVDDDIKKRRCFSTPRVGMPYNLYFDGPNDDDQVVIGVTLKLYNNEYKNGKHTYAIRKIAFEQGEAIYSGNQFDPSTNQTKVLIQKDGFLNALALCKSQDRYAFIVDKDKIFVMGSKAPGDCSAYIHGELSKISFLTPSTLLGITAVGKLHMFALDEKSGAIEQCEKTIKNKGKEIIIKNFAIDPCYPRHMLLHTEDNTLVLWNYDPCFPIPRFTKILDCIDARELWFYNDVFCFVNDNNSVSRYKLDFFALKKFDEEENCWVGDPTIKYDRGLE